MDGQRDYADEPQDRWYVPDERWDRRPDTADTAPLDPPRVPEPRLPAGADVGGQPGEERQPPPIGYGEPYGGRGQVTPPPGFEPI
ncbi:MAG TPA: hypothetical protein VES42_07595, partial [Pilimelia sp.]|nr:hypothetical protein [Pilimelia sp.]